VLGSKCVQSQCTAPGVAAAVKAKDWDVLCTLLRKAGTKAANSAPSASRFTPVPTTPETQVPPPAPVCARARPRAVRFCTDHGLDRTGHGVCALFLSVLNLIVARVMSGECVRVRGRVCSVRTRSRACVVLAGVRGAGARIWNAFFGVCQCTCIWRAVPKLKMFFHEMPIGSKKDYGVSRRKLI
jgi:hypothetical protein